MTVKDLIEKLQAQNPDLPVRIFDHDWWESFDLTWNDNTIQEDAIILDAPKHF